eukprot:12431531-Karenia_brevis.AAC.2
MRKRLAEQIEETEHREEKQHRAHVMMYSDEGKRIHIRGPYRKENRLAQQDLHKIQSRGTNIEAQNSKNTKINALKAAAQQLKTEANLEKRIMMEVAEEPVVMGTAKPYKPFPTLDVDEPWQDDEERPIEDTVVHKDPTLGLDIKVREQLQKHTLSADVLSQCKKMLQKFANHRASVDQIQQLLSLLPDGWDALLGIKTNLFQEMHETYTSENYVILMDYRKRIADMMSCVKKPPDSKRVALKVLDSIWATEIASGRKFFDSATNNNKYWSKNWFKGFKAGDLFVISVKGTNQVAAVAEVASPPNKRVEDTNILYSMLHKDRHADLDRYLNGVESVDFILFRKIFYPKKENITTRELIVRIGGSIPNDWRGIKHIGEYDEHKVLHDLITSKWSSHSNLV